MGDPLWALAANLWPNWIDYIWPHDHTALVAFFVVLASIVLAWRPKALEAHWPYPASWTIGGAIALVFLLQTIAGFSGEPTRLTLTDADGNRLLYGLDEVGTWLSIIPQLFLGGHMWWSPLTHMFVHGGFLHIFGNGIMFIIFFPRLESFMGRRRITLLYLGTGLAGSLGTFLLFPDSVIPNVGASGALYGLIGYYVIAFPKDRVPIPTPIIMMMVPAYWALVFYIGYNFFIAFALPGIAWWAHLGGLFAGMIWAASHRKKYRRLVPEWGGDPQGSATVSYRVR